MLPPILTIAALTAALTFTACKSSTPPPPAADASAANANPQGGSAAAGAATSAPASGAPVAQTPAPLSKPQPQRVTLTVNPGVEIHARINEQINSKIANVGDPWSGELLLPLVTKSRETVFAKGVPVSGHVVAAKGQGRFKGSGILAIEINQIGGRQVTASEFVVSAKGKGKRTAGLIGGGAGGGALIGALAGGKKGALIGGLIGGGAGTAGAGLTGNRQLLIPSESEVVFELSQPLSRTIER